MTRRELLAAACTASALQAGRRIDISRFSAITDEIGKTPEDAIAFTKQHNLSWVELRGIPGTKREYAFLPEADLKETAASFAANGLKVSFFNTSMLKYAWPGTSPVRRSTVSDESWARNLAQGAARFERRMEELKRALHAAHILGVNKVRVFAGQRVAEPAAAMPRVAEVLNEMAEVAAKEKVYLLVENEGSCSVGTCAELAALMKLTPSKWIAINWDPLNVTSLKEVPYPDGYALLSKKRILNVQIKGRSILEGPQRMDWKSIVLDLEKAGYKGHFGLETHMNESLIENSHASMREIARLVRELQ